MTRGRVIRIAIAATLVVAVVAATSVVIHLVRQAGRIHVTAYFENSNGVFVGDDVRIRGVNVGKIDSIVAEPTRVKISFWYEDRYHVPADAKAVVLSPTLVTARAIQLLPPYANGPTLANNAVLGLDRTAVPVEWDDVRQQLSRLTDALQPTEPGGVSTLGELINTTADNLRGEGGNIHDAIVRLSQAVSTLNDHSDDTFTSVKNLATLTAALQDSTGLLRQLNQNFGSLTRLLANDPNEVGNAVADLNSVVGEVQSFVANNRETLGITSDKLTSVTTTLNQSKDDIEQLLHVLPTTAANGVATYQPAQGLISGALAAYNFANPINFICGAIQAASRMNAEQSAKLCVQYLAPIVKNRQYNFPPFGLNPFVGPAARPNEVTYSEDWMRPDYVPPQTAPAEAPKPGVTPPPADAVPGPLLPAEAAAAASPPQDGSAPPPALTTDPAKGLQGMMIPPGAGS